MKYKTILRNTLTALSVLLAAILLGTALMTGVYSLPTGRMLTNVAESVDTIDTEGGSFTWAPGYAGTRLDGFTDNIMLQTAVYSGQDSPLTEAMLNRRMNFPKARLSPGNALINYVYGARNGEAESYGRYWHGYLLFLKPMLLFFNLSDIRMFLMLVQWGLAAMLLICAWQKGGAKLVLPLGAAIVCLNPVSTAMSMQYSSIYLLMLIFSLVELRFDSFSRQRGWVLYLLLGICTAFFDFLTYPVAALGLCLGTEILVSDRSAGEKLRSTVASGFCWGLGYGGMWSGKWLIGSPLTGRNILADALETARYRAGTEVTAAEGAGATGFSQVLAKNLGVYLTPGYLALFGLLAVLLLGLLLSKKYRLRPNSSLLSLALLALVPFGWYLVLQNHSSVHYWMTYRDLTVTVFAVLSLLGSSLEKTGGTNHG